MFFSRLTSSNYRYIVGKIKDLFHNEPATVYYVPTILKRDSRSGRTIPARGKLVDKAKNLIQKSGIRTRKKGEATDSKNKTKICQEIGKVKIVERIKCMFN